MRLALVRSGGWPAGRRMGASCGAAMRTDIVASARLLAPQARRTDCTSSFSTALAAATMKISRCRWAGWAQAGAAGGTRARARREPACVRACPWSRRQPLHDASTRRPCALQVVRMADEVASQLGADQKQRMREVFRHGCRLEWMFWDACLKQQQWPL